MDLQAFLNQLVTDIKPLAPQNVPVLAHDGPFDIDELKRWGANAPCLRIAIIGSQDSGIEGAPIDNVHVGAALITKASSDQSAGQVNLFLGTYFKTRLWSVAVGGEDAQRPQALTYRNLYDSEQAKAGVCIGTLTWTQLLQLPEFNAQGTPVPFLEAFTTYGLMPPVGPLVPGGPTVQNTQNLQGPPA